MNISWWCDEDEDEDEDADDDFLERYTHTQMMVLYTLHRYPWNMHALGFRPLLLFQVELKAYSKIVP